MRAGMHTLATHVKCIHRSCMVAPLMSHANHALLLLQERDDVLALLEELKASGKKQLTVLLLGELYDA